jgi:UDP-N-acetylglucosamine diphosphorylase/glucosamine-1-phosphate N-acetyltransferase
MSLLVFEDAGVFNLEPLSLTRPAFDLRCGACTLLERLERYFSTEARNFIVRPGLEGLCQQHHPRAAVNQVDRHTSGPMILASARWLPPAGTLNYSGSGFVGMVDEQIAYLVVDKLAAADLRTEVFPERLARWKQTLPRQQAGGRVLDYPWDVVEHNGAALETDLAFWREDSRHRRSLDGLTILGDRDQVVINATARIEPFVVIDASKGPVLIDRDAQVLSFSRLEGPCVIGAKTQILSGRVRGGSIGPECRVGGEVEASVIQGYTNKYHDGFLGHSVVGAWVNFGAGTQVSDLRNDYGPITMSVGGRRVDSGLIKIGAYLGDHTRISIGTLINAGTVVGPYSQLIASGSLLPRLFPPFSQYGHGRMQERTDLSQVLATAQTAMARRGQAWSEIDTEFFFALNEATAGERRRLIRESEQHRMRRVV